MRRLAEAGLTTREACGNAVRNITACPYAGVAADEALRRHALRRGAHAPPAAPAAELASCRASSRSPSRAVRRTTPSPRSTTSACARASTSNGSARRGFRVTVGRRHVDPADVRAPAVRVPAGGRDPGPRRRGAAALRRARRLQAQAAQPAEVPDPRDGLGRLARGVRADVRRGEGRGRLAAARSIPTTRRSRRRPAWARPGRAAARGHRGAGGGDGGSRPGLPAARSSRSSRCRRRRSRAGRAATCARRSRRATPSRP